MEQATARYTVSYRKEIPLKKETDVHRADVAAIQQQLLRLGAYLPNARR